MKSKTNAESLDNNVPKIQKEKQEKKALNKKRVKKKKGKVVSVSKYSIIVQDEKGCCFTIFDNLEAKNGDIVEF